MGEGYEGTREDVVGERITISKDVRQKTHGNLILYFLKDPLENSLIGITLYKGQCPFQKS